MTPHPQDVLVERIAEIRGRLEKATPGPWDVLNGYLVRAIRKHIAFPLFEVVTPWGLHPYDDGAAHAAGTRNATFIAHAPSDIRFLLSRLHLLGGIEGGLEGRASAREVVREVAAERQRQIEDEGWDEAHDDEHDASVLVRAAISYCTPAATALELVDNGIAKRGDVLARYPEAPLPRTWPWERRWWKPKDPRRDLVRAAALIIAEIERIDRNNLFPAEGGLPTLKEEKG